MKKILLTACVSLGVSCFLLPVQAQTLYWDGGGSDGLWCNNVNWGNQTGPDPNYDTLPGPGNTAIFRDISPAGNVQVTCAAVASRVRLVGSATVGRTIEIGTSETVDRTLTLSGAAAELIDQANTGVGRDFILSGATNAGGFKLNLQIDGFKPINVATNTSSVFVSCNISGVGGFDKIGQGILTLSGVNTYTNNTTVSSGTLLVNSPGSLAAASAVTVNGGTLGGDGTINGPVTVNAGGRISPGTSVGTLTLGGDLTLSGGLFIELDKSLTPSNDVISVTGTLTNAGTGTVTVTNLGPALAVGDSFQLFNKQVLNGEALTVVSDGGVVFTNKLGLDGSIAVLSVPAPPAPAQPVITSIDGAGTTSVTVNYSNTVAGTNYTLQYNTNLNTANWYDVGTAPAGGPTASQTDTPPSGDPERYYRVYFVTP